MLSLHQPSVLLSQGKLAVKKIFSLIFFDFNPHPSEKYLFLLRQHHQLIFYFILLTSTFSLSSAELLVIIFREKSFQLQLLLVHLFSFSFFLTTLLMLRQILQQAQRQVGYFVYFFSELHCLKLQTSFTHNLIEVVDQLADRDMIFPIAVVVQEICLVRDQPIIFTQKWQILFT